MRLYEHHLVKCSDEQLHDYLQNAKSNFEGWAATENTAQVNEWARQYNDIEEELIRRGFNV